MWCVSAGGVFLPDLLGLQERLEKTLATVPLHEDVDTPLDKFILLELMATMRLHYSLLETRTLFAISVDDIVNPQRQAWPILLTQRS